MSQEPKNKNEKRDWAEEIEVAGNDLVERVKDIVKEGNVRRLIIRNSENEVLIEVPLTPAVVVGGVATIINPVLAALGAFAALIARIKIEVVRVDDVDDETETIDVSRTSSTPPPVARPRPAVAPPARPPQPKRKAKRTFIPSGI